MVAAEANRLEVLKNLVEANADFTIKVRKKGGGKEGGTGGLRAPH